MEQLRKKILKLVSEGKLPPSEAASLLRDTDQSIEKDIAVIGISAKLPHAKNVTEYWNNLMTGKDCVTPFPDARRKDTDSFLDRPSVDRTTYNVGGYLDELDKFDASFFRISPHEAELIDPCHRLFLETAYESIEDAGYGGDAITGSNTGIFVGIDHNKKSIEYLDYINLHRQPEMLSFVGSWPGILASRLSYALNLSGPSVVLDTACSSGLVSIHYACRALQHKECDLAIAGGINVMLLPLASGIMGDIESDQIRAFDKHANGTVWGEGAGAVLLKPLGQALKDNDQIYAVIKGSAVNNDGASNGITAPSAEAQENVLLRAWKEANIPPETISYIETHGTGTILGDPIEVKALTNAFAKSTSLKQFCGIGSVKSNIGHLVGASGLASFIKLLLAFKHKELPATIHFSDPNPYISFFDTAVYVVDQPQKWDADYPRRAGVTSLGFSGTNCHIVLEEAPPRQGISNATAGDYHIVTLSAKNQGALMEAIKRYHAFTCGAEEQELADISFTSTMGRGHFECRMALIVNSTESLRDNLLFLAKEGLQNHAGRKIYYGEHKLVQTNKKEKRENELTEANKRVLGFTAQPYYIELESAADEHSQVESLSEIAKLYVAGASIQWTKVCRTGGRTSLPTYPLERVRHWVEPSTAIRSEETGKSTWHIQKILESADQDIYSVELNHEQWFLSEHQYKGIPIVPGTAVLEMLLQVAGMHQFSQNVQLQQISLLAPIAVEGNEKKEVQIICSKTHSGQIKLVSKDSYHNWIVHAEAIVSLNENKRGAKTVSLSDALAACQDTPKPASAKMANLEFGPRWDNVKSVRRGKDQALMEISLPKPFLGDLHDFELHPAMLDNALNGMPLDLETNATYLPYFYGSVTKYGSMTDRCYSYIRNTTHTLGGVPEVLTFDVAVYGTDGQLVLEVQDYTVKRVHQFNVAAPPQMYEMKWIQAQPAEASIREKQRNILLFNASVETGDRFASLCLSQGDRVIEIGWGSEFIAIDEQHYVISHSQADYVKMIEGVLRTVPQIDSIVYLVNERTPATVESLEQLQQKGILSIYRLSKALIECRVKNELDLFIVGRNMMEVTGLEETLQPYYAALLGFSVVMEQELPYVRCRCIDIDESSPLQLLYNEMWGSSLEGKVAFRQGDRYVQEFTTSEPPDDGNASEVRIKQGGVYLITGGTGGIGLEIGKYLASLTNVTLALTSRKPLPDLSEWNRIIHNNEDEKLSAVLRSIREIEATGSKVVHFAADVSIETIMLEVLDRLQSTHGQLNGIIHCAGIAGRGYLVQKSERMFTDVLSSKLKGSWVLEKLAFRSELDFVVLCSSVTALLGGLGQADYSAANAFLDAYSSYLNKKGIRAISINWALWKNTGLSPEYNQDDNWNIFKTLDPERAIRAFAEIFQTNKRNVIVGELDEQVLAAMDLQELPFRIDSRLDTRIRGLRHSRRESSNVVQNRSHVLLAGRSNEGAEQYTAMEQAVGDVWGEILGLKQINVYDSFYALGGDSILATKIVNRINETAPKKITISDLFEFNTIAEIAGLMQESMPSEADEHHADDAREEKVETRHTRVKLSNAQQRIWFMHKIHPNFIAYNLPTKFMIEEEVDCDCLKRAVHLLAERHDVLRTVIIEEDGEPYQTISESMTFDVEFIDLSRSKLSFESVLEADNRLPFHFAESLVRAKFLKIGDAKYVFYLNANHVIMDGWSMGIMIKDLFQLYQDMKLNRPSSLEPVAKTYYDIIQEQQQWYSSSEFKHAEQYFLEELSGELPVLQLPTDQTRPEIVTFNGDYVKIRLTSEMTKEIKRTASKLNCTVHVLLLTAYAVLLHKLSKDEDIIIGMPYSGRDDADWENVVGLLMNTVCVRIKGLHPDLKLTEVIDQVRKKCLESFKRGKYPFDMLVRKLDVRRDQSRSPVFSTMFQFFENIPQEIERSSQFEISFQCTEKEGCIEIRPEFNTDLYNRETIERWGGYYQQILISLLLEPGMPIGDVQMISSEEERKVVSEFNDTFLDHPHQTIAEMFKEMATLFPHLDALVFGEKQMTYEELDRQSTIIAGTLVDAGIGPNDIVGLMADRSLEMIVHLLAITKAGGAFMPIDPDYPVERIRYMIEDSGMKLLLTAGNTVEGYSGRTVTMKYPVEGNASDVGTLPEQDFDNLAYVIYTSGTTGRPKGVKLKHRGVSNLKYYFVSNLGVTPEDKIVQFSSISFDAFVWEFTMAILTGAQLHIIPRHLAYNARLFEDYMQARRISIATLPPPFITQLRADTMDALRILVAAGSPSTPSLVSKWSDRVTYINAYGPTESTVCATAWTYDPAASLQGNVPIGKPLPNTSIFILDEKGKLSAIGTIGEICISGIGLADGYINNEELTSSKFVANPFALNEKLYRTGDLGKWRSDGNVEFVGRIDDQVKIRGNRIEIKEVENVLHSLPQIKQCAVEVKWDGEGHAYLCAYMVSDHKLAISEVMNSLSRKLPNYMVPSRYIELESMPINANGKVDRTRLPEPGPSRGSNDYVPPRDELEHRLCSIWEEILEILSPSIYDDFYELGGHSLRLTVLAAKIEVEFAVEIPVQNLIGSLTISKLAEYIKRQLLANQLEHSLDENEITLSAVQEWTRMNQDLDLLSSDRSRIRDDGEGSIHSRTEITGIEPFNDIFYRSCFFNSFFPIVKHFGRDLNDFFVHDFMVYRFSPENPIEHGAKLLSTRNVNEILEEIGIGYDFLHQSGNVVTDAKREISNGCPLIISIDSYYLSIRNDCYQKVHWPHTLLVYGYDDESGTFVVMEHTHRDSLTYARRTVSYRELNEAYVGYISNFYTDNKEPTFYRFYPKHIDTFRHNAHGSQYDGKGTSHTELSKWSAESIKELQKIIDYVLGLIQDPPSILRNQDEVAVLFKNIINARKIEEYRLKLKRGDGKALQIVSQVVLDWEYVRSMFIKYGLTHRLSPDNRERIESALHRIWTKEQLYCMDA